MRVVSNLPWIHINAVDHGSIRIEVDPCSGRCIGEPYMAYWDIWEKFLKFLFNKEVSPYCGDDIYQFRTEEVCESGILGGWEI